jgi:hypothetical protein
MRENAGELGKCEKWVGVLFLSLVAIVAIFYLDRPERVQAVRRVWELAGRWRDRLAQSPRVWLYPIQPDTVQFDGLARFGDDLEFLGCDLAITQDEAGTHVWQITLWRTQRPLSVDYLLSTYMVPADETSPSFTSEHLLGEGFVPPLSTSPTPATSHWRSGEVMIDATLLPPDVALSGDYHLFLEIQSTADGAPVPVETEVLHVDQQGRLLICR